MYYVTTEQHPMSHGTYYAIRDIDGKIVASTHEYKEAEKIVSEMNGKIMAKLYRP